MIMSPVHCSPNNWISSGCEHFTFLKLWTINSGEGAAGTFVSVLWNIIQITKIYEYGQPYAYSSAEISFRKYYLWMTSKFSKVSNPQNIGLIVMTLTYPLPQVVLNMVNHTWTPIGLYASHIHPLDNKCSTHLIILYMRTEPVTNIDTANFTMRMAITEHHHQWKMKVHIFYFTKLGPVQKYY